MEKNFMIKILPYQFLVHFEWVTATVFLVDVKHSDAMIYYVLRYLYKKRVMQNT